MAPSTPHGEAATDADPPCATAAASSPSPSFAAQGTGVPPLPPPSARPPHPSSQQALQQHQQNPQHHRSTLPPSDPSAATIHALVNRPDTSWGFVDKLTSAAGAGAAATNNAVLWTPHLLVLNGTHLFLFSTQHDPYVQPPLDVFRLGIGTSIRLSAEAGVPGSVIITVTSPSKEWDLRCAPAGFPTRGGSSAAPPDDPSSSDSVGADGAVGPPDANVPNQETLLWVDRLKAAIQAGKSRAKSEVLRRANLEHQLQMAAP
ncbi:hypothetical protein HK405_010329, partial [Cladochytrium tenue]